MNKLGTKLGAIAMSAVMALSFAPSAAITSLAASGDDLLDATFGVEPVYRLYNPNSGEHLFTTDVLERDSLVKENWDNEGAKWNAPSVSAEGIYRLYNPSTGEHLYTSDGLEIAHLVNDEKWEEDFGGYPAFYAADDDLDPDAITINRFFNPAGTGVSAHIFSADPAEIKALTDKGYEKENGFGGYPLDYEPEEPVEELTVSIDNPTPKVGDTIRVLIHDEDGNEVNPADVDAKISWYANGMVLLGETDAEFYVSSNMAGAVLTVVVTIADEEYTDTTKAVAGEDKSAEVELVDDYGLQSDGTGIIGDKLTVTYGADFGTPTNVSWYKNGKVVATNSVGDEVNAGLTRTISASAWGVGTYKVTITNTDGDMATTNEIVITDKEEAAKITAFTLEDDYTDGEDVDYGTQDIRAVATVTMTKNYDGVLRIYKATDTKYTSALPNDTLRTSVAEPLVTAAQAMTATTGVPTNYVAPTDAGGGRNATSVLTTSAATNYQMLNMTTVGAGMGYINDDGTVTYKWVLDDTGVERGTEYVVTFDQQSISTDTPGTGTANVSKKVAAPYVTKPAKIAVTKVSNGNAPEIEFQDANGASLGWFGYKATAADQNVLAAGDTTLTDLGASGAAIYGATSKTNDPKASGVTTLEAATVGVADAVVKGTWKGTATATSLAYWFATVKFAKGIFQADEFTLTSEAKANAQDAATDMDVLQDKDTATTAVVKFSNLRADGTLYIIRGEGNDTGVTTSATATASTTVEEAMDYAFKLFDENNANTYRKAVKVKAGTLEAKVEGAIDKVKAANGTTTAYAEEYTNCYGAVFIPDDQANYGKIMTDDIGAGASATKWASNSTAKTAETAEKIGGPVLITHKLTKYELPAKFASGVTGFTGNGTTEYYNKSGEYTVLGGDVTDATANVVTLKDQFGEVMNASYAETPAAAAAHAVADWTLTTRSDSNTTGATGVQIEFGWNAAAGSTAAGSAAGPVYNTIKVTIKGTNTAGVKSTWTGTTGLGQTITATIGADEKVSLTIS